MCEKTLVTEVLADPSIAVKLADTKAAGEVKALDDFYTMLQTDPDRAYYGIRHCERAAEQQAIELLMVSDELFRAQDIAQRKRYVSLVDSVKENGAEVKIFSSLHVSGEQLGQLSGVAAILRFPMPEEDDEDNQDVDSDDD
ncbi:protein pelota homolog [Physella acuta]|uniref:protein pelota homolog n=1 Tax=Physella acuta TaxID=109671 RepID=UPI0027DE1DF7|nr:protein pelota homolog [Physella acuta]